MTVKVSQLMGMEVYTDNAQHVGRVYDIILDLQKGEVVRLTLEPIKVQSKDEAKRIFKEKTVMYKSVKAVEKIVIVSSRPIEEPIEEPVAEPAKPMPYSYRYRRQ
ncbi:MAG TPA: PRC-barrel domain-containing protein [Candidatus Norongarragalinales archaeon]|jgi:sporulation protein YlmC with PRC-barrel domain|nr:PRC-barrel domain-containing protein [Candidatus Norongarragalinales archaeon]